MSSFSGEYDEKRVYIVHQSDGLKSHLSFDIDGRNVLCGRSIKKYGRKVKLFQFESSIEMFFICKLKVCEKCQKIIGIDELFGGDT